MEKEAMKSHCRTTLGPDVIQIYVLEREWEDSVKGKWKGARTWENYWEPDVVIHKKSGELD